VILYGTRARIIRDAEHPWGRFTEEEFADFVERVSRGWGLRSAALGAAELWASSLAGDERFADWLAKFARQSLCRRDVVPFIRSIAAYDLVDVFPAVRVPTLVLHRTGDSLVPVSHARWLAQQIPAARLVECPALIICPSWVTPKAWRPRSRRSCWGRGGHRRRVDHVRRARRHASPLLGVLQGLRGIGQAGCRAPSEPSRSPGFRTYDGR
jgi:pimeloyl-ACP methyl ester carboxylesterase